MLVLMTITHLPTRLTDPLGQPFGFVSAAEGFVLLSAFVAGLVYSRISYNRGVDAMRQAFWRRALKVYLSQAATLLFLFTIITALSLRIDQPAVKNLLSFYLANPREGFVYSLLLVYEPALLDILPMYIFFMLMSPWVLAFAMRHGWTGVMVASATVWGLAQFGLSEWLYELAVRYCRAAGAFSRNGRVQCLRVAVPVVRGLVDGGQPQRARRAALPLSEVAAGGGWRSWRCTASTGATTASTARRLSAATWSSTCCSTSGSWGRCASMNLVALGILAIQFGPDFMRRIPRLHWLEAMGRASLPVFCAHLVAVLTVLAVYGDSQTARPWWGDALLLGVVFSGLYGVARAVQWWDERGSRPRRR